VELVLETLQKSGDFFENVINPQNRDSMQISPIFENAYGQSRQITLVHLRIDTYSPNL